MKKAALVTGASQGIGEAIALALSEQGYFIYLLARNKDRLLEVASRCRSGAMVLSCDINQYSEVDRRLDEIKKNPLTQLEVIVNNAGIFKPSPFATSTDDQWMTQFQVNLFSAVHLTRSLWSTLAASKKGAIVNISSTLGLRPVGPNSAYSASKAAMISWTQSLAQEGGPLGIRANAVCPGIVDTPIHGFHSQEKQEKEASLKSMSHLQPLGRIGLPLEIAETVAFLASDRSSWTTGAVVSVDGGINL